jgi:hypothetical protein
VPTYIYAYNSLYRGLLRIGAVSCVLLGESEEEAGARARAEGTIEAEVEAEKAVVVVEAEAAARADRAVFKWFSASLTGLSSVRSASFSTVATSWPSGDWKRANASGMLRGPGKLDRGTRETHLSTVARAATE